MYEIFRESFSPWFRAFLCGSRGFRFPSMGGGPRSIVNPGLSLLFTHGKYTVLKPWMLWETNPCYISWIRVIAFPMVAQYIFHWVIINYKTLLIIPSVKFTNILWWPLKLTYQLFYKYVWRGLHFHSVVVYIQASGPQEAGGETGGISPPPNNPEIQSFTARSVVFLLFSNNSCPSQ